MEQIFPESIFRKLKHKTIALFGLGLILFVLLLAIFAYWLAPDASPNANRMIVELGAKAPGFEKTMLLLPKQNAAANVSAINYLLFGKPDNFNYLPINSYQFEQNKLRVQHFIDDAISDTIVYDLKEILPKKIQKTSLTDQQQYLVTHNIKPIKFYLGTDRYGRDILSRLLIGARVSLTVGFVAVLLALSIGVLMGLIAGYFGGWIDSLIMFVINIFWSVPTLLLVFALTLTLGKGFWEIFVAIGLTMWVGTARLIRGQVLVLREMDYIEAAKAIGASHFRILFWHILPNIAGPITVMAASNFAAAILIEAGLSFLGIGIQPPQPSWGLMIKEHYNFLITNQPLAAIIPGAAIMLLVYAFNVLSNALRDAFDVRN